MARTGTMTLLHGFTAPSAYRRGYASIGNFDGVHRGHQSILRRLVERARSQHIPAIVVTFEPHPAAVLAPERLPPRLTTLDRKAELIAACGIDTLIAIPPSQVMLGMSASEFFETIIVREMQASGLIEGPNFCFGRNREGTIQTLQDLGGLHQVEVEIVTPQVSGSDLVSSTTIRQALREGNVVRAAELLGRPHRLTGRVSSGAGRGRQLGFPTANLTDIPELVPAPGVYAGTAFVGQDAYRAAVHFGPNPTFTESSTKLEVHLLDFHGDLYGQVLSLDLQHQLRGIKTFASAEALQQQIDFDLAAVRLIRTTTF